MRRDAEERSEGSPEAAPADAVEELRHRGEAPLCGSGHPAVGRKARSPEMMERWFAVDWELLWIVAMIAVVQTGGVMSVAGLFVRSRPRFLKIAGAVNLGVAVPAIAGALIGRHVGTLQVPEAWPLALSATEACFVAATVATAWFARQAVVLPGPSPTSGTDSHHGRET